MSAIFHEVGAFAHLPQSRGDFRAQQFTGGGLVQILQFNLGQRDFEFQTQREQVRGISIRIQAPQQIDRRAGGDGAEAEIAVIINLVRDREAVAQEFGQHRGLNLQITFLAGAPDGISAGPLLRPQQFFRGVVERFHAAHHRRITGVNAQGIVVQERRGRPATDQ